MLVKCVKCGNGLSPAAKNCPQCRYPTSVQEYRKQLGNCRACGVELRRSLHRNVVSSRLISLNGTLHYDTYQHVPCTQCGEPKPFYTLRELPFGDWLTAFIVIALFVCAYKLW